MAKKVAIKTIEVHEVYSNDQWCVNYGELKSGRGRPESVERLFLILGEKLPFESLNGVSAHLKKRKIRRTGVYVAHDSMGFARYIGRGNIFQRLRARHAAQKLELRYFSFYIVKERKHEREIETLLIRAAGPLLQFNTKKKRVDIRVGNIKDYEAGTQFFERRYMRGTKPKSK
ncbi:MAG: hypothetical protein ACYCSP_02830 [Acidobacteriaceae bacterium]